MEWKDLLEGIEDADKIIEAIEKNAKAKSAKILVDDGKESIYIPKSRLDEEIGKKKTITEQLDNATKTIKGLEKDLTDNKEALTSLSDLKEKNETLQKQLEDTTQTQRIKAAVNSWKRKPRDVEDLVKFINKEKIKFDESGDIKEGLEDQLEGLVKSKDYLFTEITGGTGNPGNPSKGTGGKGTGELSLGEQLAKARKESGGNAAEQQGKFFE